MRMTHSVGRKKKKLSFGNPGEQPGSFPPPSTWRERGRKLPRRNVCGRNLGSHTLWLLGKPGLPPCHQAPPEDPELLPTKSPSTSSRLGLLNKNTPSSSGNRRSAIEMTYSEGECLARDSVLNSECSGNQTAWLSPTSRYLHLFLH